MSPAAPSSPSPDSSRPDGAPAPHHDPATRVLRSLVGPVYAPTAIYSVGSGAIQPVLVLAALAVGMSHAGASSVVGVLGLVGVVSAPVAGRLVGALGGRRAMVTATVVAVAALGGILGAMSLPGTGAVTGFVAAVVLLAVASNIWALARQDYVADAVPTAARARALSLLGGMMRLGVLVGPALGSAVIAVAGLRAPFALHMVTALIALGLVLTQALPTAELLAGSCAPASTSATTGGEALGAVRPAPSAPSARGRERADLRATAVVAVAMTALTLLRANRIVLVPLWGAHLGMSGSLISATFAAGALMDVAMFLPAGRWMDRYGRLAGMLPSLFVMGAALVLTATWTSPTGFVVGACLMGLGNGFGSGIVMTMGVDLAPTVGRERFLGWWQGIGNIGTAAGPFIVAALTATAGLTAGMWFTAVLGLVGGVWAWLAMPRAYARLGIDMRGRPTGRRL